MFESKFNQFANAFTVDFWDKSIIFNGKAYPAGYFSTQIINMDSDAITDLVQISIPAITLHMNLINKKKFSDNEFADAKDAVFNIYDQMCKTPPFSLLDKEIRQAFIETFLTEENIIKCKNYFAFDIVRTEAMLNDINTNFAPEYIQNIEDARFIYDTLCEMLLFYGYYSSDCCNFKIAARNFAEHIMQATLKKTKSNLAKAANWFFNDPKILGQLDDANAFAWNRRFDSQIRPFQLFTQINHPRRKKELIAVQRYYFDNFMDFLITDFHTGLANGHYPKRCKICGKYFLVTDARNKLYCDGYDPNDQKGRTCRKVGQDRKRVDRQKEQTLANPIKRICSTRLGTIRTHLARGIITDEVALKAKAYAQTLKNRALRNHEYYISGEYAKDMESDAIYNAIK